MDTQNRKTLWIGLGHVKGVGKDTVGNMMIEWVLQNVGMGTTVSFARELKLIAQRLFEKKGMRGPLAYDMDRVAKETPLPELNNLTPRDIYIKLGGCIREICPTYWMDFVLDDPWYARTMDVVVVTDVRYLNEVERLHEMGAILIDVMRPGYTSDDPVDAALDGVLWQNYTISNDGDLEHLRNSVGHIMQGIWDIHGALR